MGTTFFDYVSNDGKNLLFGLPATEELVGRPARLPDGTELRFETELAVKCDDDLFLAARGGRLLLVEELPDESLRALDAEAAAADAAALPEELEGWETDLCFASGYVLTALFKDGALTLRPSPEPIIANPFGSGGALEAPKVQEAPPVLATLSLRAVKTGEKRFLLRFPETGETVFLDGRRFLLYALLRGRIVTGFVEVPARD
jgi:hypothetical protein